MANDPLPDRPTDSLPALLVSDLRGENYSRRAELIEQLDASYVPITPVDSHKIEHLADLMLRAEQYRYAIETWQEQQVRDSFQKIHAAKSKLSPAARKEAWKHGWRPPESLELGDWITPEDLAAHMREVAQLEDTDEPLPRIAFALAWVKEHRVAKIRRLQLVDPEANELDELLQMSVADRNRIRPAILRAAYTEKLRLERRIDTQRRLRAKVVMEALPPDRLIRAQQDNEKSIEAIIKLFKIRPDTEITAAYRAKIRADAAAAAQEAEDLRLRFRISDVPDVRSETTIRTNRSPAPEGENHPRDPGTPEPDA